MAEFSKRANISGRVRVQKQALSQQPFGKLGLSLKLNRDTEKLQENFFSAVSRQIQKIGMCGCHGQFMKHRKVTLIARGVY